MGTIKAKASSNYNKNILKRPGDTSFSHMTLYPIFHPTTPISG